MLSKMAKDEKGPLIYKGEIMAEPGNKATPRLIGRTKQHEFSGIIEDLEGMDSALKCFKSIEVVCLEH